MRGHRINQAILNLICGTGIPLTIVNTDEWKNVISMVDSSVTTYGSSSFVDTYIPGEAAWWRGGQTLSGDTKRAWSCRKQATMMDWDGKQHETELSIHGNDQT